MNIYQETTVGPDIQKDKDLWDTGLLKWLLSTCLGLFTELCFHYAPKDPSLLHLLAEVFGFALNVRDIYQPPIPNINVQLLTAQILLLVHADILFYFHLTIHFSKAEFPL